ncbi:MAG: hypothetical protein R3B90_08510 [Planctomycetaceae bacterium]
MSLRGLQITALLSAFVAGGQSTTAEACCWLWGGGAGYTAYRPIFGGGLGILRPRYVGYAPTYASGYGYGGFDNCCPSPCQSGGCSSGSCGSCGYTSYYISGESCGNCGVVGCPGGCGVNCDTNYSPASKEPEPDSTTIRRAAPEDRVTPTYGDGVGTDDFRGNRGPMGNPMGGGYSPDTNPMPAGTRGSIPSTGGSIPAFPDTINDPNLEGTGGTDFGTGRGVRDNPATNGGYGTDAPEWRLPTERPAGTDPADPFPNDATDPDSQLLKVQPLNLGDSIASSYTAERHRIVLWSNYRTPTVARQIPAGNENWVPVPTDSQVARK